MKLRLGARRGRARSRDTVVGVGEADDTSRPVGSAAAAVAEPVDPATLARNRRRRLVLGVVVSFAIMFVGVVVLPTRAWFGQQRDIASAQAELRQVRHENDKLERQVARLSDDAAIERQARRDLGLVKPGEESYTVTALPTPVVNLPDVWPFNLLQEPLAKAAERGPAEPTP